MRERRGIASPNAGFIARLMQLATRLAAPTPTETRLYRMVPALGFGLGLGLGLG